MSIFPFSSQAQSNGVFDHPFLRCTLQWYCSTHVIPPIPACVMQKGGVTLGIDDSYPIDNMCDTRFAFPLIADRPDFLGVGESRQQPQGSLLVSAR